MYLQRSMCSNFKLNISNYENVFETKYVIKYCMYMYICRTEKSGFKCLRRLQCPCQIGCICAIRFPAYVPPVQRKKINAYIYQEST